jgi:stage V sporulation protein B
MAKKQIFNRIDSEKGVKIREGDKKILIELAKTAFPIIIGTAIFSFTNLIDARMVMDRLVNGVGMTYETAKSLYGQLAGKYVVLTTLPVAISTALATAAIPNIAASAVLNEKRAVARKINTSLRLAMIISIPAAVGIGVLGNQIIALLFPSHPDGGELLIIGAVSIVFLALAQISTGMLQAIGKVNIPAIAAIIGVSVKIPLNYVLIGSAGLNIRGAVISTIACYVVASSIDVIALWRITKVKLDIAGFLLKPSICAVLMGMVCYVSYYFLYFIIPNNTLCALVSIVMGLISYFVFMLYIKGFDKMDLALVPMGERFVGFLQKYRLLH